MSNANCEAFNCDAFKAITSLETHASIRIKPLPLPTASLDCSRLFTRAVKVLNLLLVRQQWQCGRREGARLIFVVRVDSSSGPVASVQAAVL